MPILDEPKFQREGDEIAEPTSFSWLSLLGLLSSLVGIFSLTYVQVLPFAIFGALLGAVTLLTASRARLNWFARAFGFLAVVIGSTVSSAGFSSRMLQTNSDLEQARKIAELYLNSLSAKNLEKVYYLAGIKSENESENEAGDESGNDVVEKIEDKSRAAMSRLDADVIHTEIRNRNNQAKWVYVGLDSESISMMGYTYRLRYRDEGQTIPPEYTVYARKDCDKFDEKDEVHWFVDAVASKSK